MSSSVWLTGLLGKGRVKILNSFHTSSLANMSAGSHALIHAIVSGSAESPVLSPVDKRRLETTESDHVSTAVWELKNILAEGNPASDTQPKIMQPT